MRGVCVRVRCPIHIGCCRSTAAALCAVSAATKRAGMRQTRVDLLQVAVCAALLRSGSGQGEPVTACTGSNRENCIDMERCTVNIEGSTYDLSSLRRPGGSTAAASSGPSSRARERKSSHRHAPSALTLAAHRRGWRLRLHGGPVRGRRPDPYGLRGGHVPVHWGLFFFPAHARRRVLLCRWRREQSRSLVPRSILRRCREA